MIECKVCTINESPLFEGKNVCHVCNKLFSSNRHASDVVALQLKIKKLEDEKIFSFMFESYRETTHYFEREFLKKKISILEQKLEFERGAWWL